MAIDIQLVYKMVLVLVYSFFATTWMADHLIPKFKKAGYTTKDRYKRGRPNIADMGGMAIFIGILISLVLSQLLIKEFEIKKLLIFYFIPIVYAVFGVLDDLIDVGQKWKIIAPFFMALPVGLLVDTKIQILGSLIDFGVLFPFLIAPLFVMVIMNLVNMHSGFNGLASGLSGIIMLFLAIRTVLVHDVMHLLYLIPVMGATWAYWRFDKFPAKMLWGNSGSMLVGAAIGAYMIMINDLLFGVVLFAPHIIDFLMYLYIKVTGRKWVKFGKLRKDGTIEAPDPIKMKFLFPYYFRMTEPQVVLVQYALQVVFGVLALLLV